jgi:hypothetical protein
VKLVKESLNEFQQGLDPYKTMEIGSSRNPQVGDTYKCMVSIEWGNNKFVPTHVPQKDWDTSVFHEGKLYKIIDIGGRDFDTFDMGNDTINIIYGELEKYFKRV